MADIKPYVERNAGDFIEAEDWNNMQIKIREDLTKHNHHGGLDQGGKLGAAAIDPGSELTIKGLNITGVLSAKDALLVTAPITITADKDLTVGGNADIQGNLEVAGSYHNGEVLSGSLKVDVSFEEIGKVNDWVELWSTDEIEIKKDSIIQLTINGSWALAKKNSTAMLGAMINGESIYPDPVNPYGASQIEDLDGLVPIGYSTVQERPKGKYKFGVGVSGKVTIRMAMLHYLIIPK